MSKQQNPTLLTDIVKIQNDMLWARWGLFAFIPSFALLIIGAWLAIDHNMKMAIRGEVNNALRADIIHEAEREATNSANAAYQAEIEAERSAAEIDRILHNINTDLISKITKVVEYVQVSDGGVLAFKGPDGTGRLQLEPANVERLSNGKKPIAIIQYDVPSGGGSDAKAGVLVLREAVHEFNKTGTTTTVQ